MPEEVFETTPPTASKSFDWPKIILAAVLGLGLLIGAAYAGYWYGTKSSKFKVQSSKLPSETQPQQTPTPEATPSRPKEVDETTNWETYTSEELGFSIKLPSNWHRSDRISIEAGPTTKLEKFSPLSEFAISEMLQNDPYNPSYYLEIEITDNPNNISLRDWATDAKHAPQGADQIVTEIVFNNYPSTQVVGNQGLGYIDYFLQHGGKLYNLGYYYLENDPTWERPQEISKELFDQILSTFKFLD